MVVLPFVTLYNSTAIQNVSIGVINCQSACNKSDEIADVVKDVNINALFITGTRLTENIVFNASCNSDSQERWGSRHFSS